MRSECRLYRDHVAGVVTSCSRLAGMIRRAFKTRNTDLLWMAFQVYVKRKIMYASSVWSPLLRCDVTAIERIQRRFTKALPGLAQLSYEQCLKTLNTLQLEQSRNKADLVFVIRCLHHLCDINLQDVGILPSCNNERNGKLRLGQCRPLNLSASFFFKFRIPSKWNELPDVVANAVTLNRFKYAVKNHYSYVADSNYVKR